MAPPSVALTDDASASTISVTTRVRDHSSGRVGTEKRASRLINVGRPPAGMVTGASSCTM